MAGRDEPANAVSSTVVVRDVAASAARDEDLGAERARAVHRDHARGAGRRAPRPDRGHESRGARAHHRHVDHARTLALPSLVFE